jgi:uncharacterized protein (TIGR04222 family)
MFPFNLDGHDFLILYPALWLASLIGFWIYRQAQTPQRNLAAIGGSKGGLDRYQIAWLSGGARAVFAAALTRLVELGLVSVDGDRCQPIPGAAAGLGPGRALHRIEVELLRHLPHGLERAWQSFSGAPLGLVQELETRGLAQGQRRLAEVAGPFGPLWLGLLLMGGARLLQGLSKDRPVGYLVLEMFVAAGVCGSLLNHLALPRLQPAGQKLLRQLKARGRPALGRSAVAETVPGADPGLAVALFGTAVLMDSQLEPVHLAARRVVPSRDGQAASGGDVWYGGHYADSSSGVTSSDSGSGDSGTSCGGGGCGGCGS